MDASGSLVLDDEGSGVLVGDDLKFFRATGVYEIDGMGGPLGEDDDPLLLSHGEVLVVVLPVEA